MEVNISGAKIFYTFPFEFPILGKFQITETLVVSWIVMILITGLCIFLTRDLKVENISKRQALAEFIVEKANNFVLGNMSEKFRYMIPFVAALFATSVVSNLISLIGLRSPTADLSTEAA
jgi:F-type H+-transporting ATPase subunit a